LAVSDGLVSGVDDDFLKQGFDESYLSVMEKKGRAD
jgi:hypothetical protein